MSINEVKASITQSLIINKYKKAEGTNIQIPETSKGDLLTKAETKYFEKVFPEASKEIREEYFYGKQGTQKKVQVGTVIDRKG